MIKNKVGLEAEFFVRNKKDEIVYPSHYGFKTDDYIILGEFRAAPGSTREETIANFMLEYYKVIFRAQKGGVFIDIGKGWTTLKPAFYAEILRKMGTKVVAQAKNIYGVDILECSDSIIKRGKITGQKASIGLHIHFSSADHAQETWTQNTYLPVEIPIGLGDAKTSLHLYRKAGQEAERKLRVSASRITRPVISSIVETFDTEVLPAYIPKVSLKYRQPGFYEEKTHGGFEYRSLPFTQEVFDRIHDIVDFAFTQLEKL